MVCFTRLCAAWLAQEEGDSLYRRFASLDLAQNLARSEFILRKNKIVPHPIFTAFYPAVNKIFREGEFDNR